MRTHSFFLSLSLAKQCSSTEPATPIQPTNNNNNDNNNKILSLAANHRVILYCSCPSYMAWDVYAHAHMKYITSNHHT